MFPLQMKSRFCMMALNVAFVGIVGLSMPAFAEERPNRELLKDLEALALRCVVQLYRVDAHGSRSETALKSVCPELQQSNEGVQATVDGDSYRLTLSESPEADDGDLDDLKVQDSHGQVVATRRNVAAFGNVFLAMTGGRDEFKEQSEQ